MRSGGRNDGPDPTRTNFWSGTLERFPPEWNHPPPSPAGLTRGSREIAGSSPAMTSLERFHSAGNRSSVPVQKLFVRFRLGPSLRAEGEAIQSCPVPPLGLLRRCAPRNDC